MSLPDRTIITAEGLTQPSLTDGSNQIQSGSSADVRPRLSMPLYSNTIDAPPSTAGGPPSDFDAKSGAIGPPPSAQPSGPSLLQNIKETWTEAEILPDTTYQHHYQRKIKHYQDGFNKFGSGLVKSPGIVGDLRPLISMAGDAHLPKIDNPFWTMLVHLQCAGLKEL
jgi:hypothetical protein